MAEVRSWENSLPVLAADLRDAGLKQVEVLVEHRLPLSSKRADVVLCGVNPRSGDPSYLVVELKQWSSAQTFPDDDSLVLVDAYAGRPVLHPCHQVQGYVEYLADFVKALSRLPDSVKGAAYLHNASENGVVGLRQPSMPAPMFTQDQRGQWLDFLNSHFADESGAAAADLLLGSAFAPSKQLMKLAAQEIQQQEQFVLLDQQKVAYQLVMGAVRKASRDDHKSVVIVTGGPGSGKSVIALSLLGELFRQGRTAEHATGSKAFTSTLRKVAGHRNPRVKSLFGYFNQFLDAEPNSLDVLILDEAHRIRETSNSRYTPRERRSSRKQVEELLDVARVPVFLLDEHQVVRPGEIGTVAEIEDTARSRGLSVHRVDLDAQFRSGGSRVYEEWVLRLLGLAPGGPVRWSGDEHYSVSVVDTPEELEHALRTHMDDGSSARMTAGFCWSWSDVVRDQPLAPDVQIGSWARAWNNKEERRHQSAPARSLWATEEGGFEQVGCVYTAQGFEYDWSGVILGPDLVWREDRFVSDVSQSRDPAFRGKAAGDFDGFVRNVYKVLLTRGMAGTVMYSTDRQTRQFLRTLVNP